MGGRRRNRVWTELDTRELFDVLRSIRAKLGTLMSRAPIGSPVYEDIARVNAAVTPALEAVSRSSAGPHGAPEVYHDPKIGERPRR